MATGRKWKGTENGSDKRKPSPPVATSCLSRSMVRRESVARPTAAPQTKAPASHPLCDETMDPSRIHPARGRRRAPTVPANPRKRPDEMPALAGNPRLRRRSPERPAWLCKPEVSGSIPVGSIAEPSGLRPLGRATECLHLSRVSASASTVVFEVPRQYSPISFMGRGGDAVPHATSAPTARAACASRASAGVLRIREVGDGPPAWRRLPS
jgi:hypothetical protein